jgi:hypothetical protein
MQSNATSLINMMVFTYANSAQGVSVHKHEGSAEFVAMGTLYALLISERGLTSQRFGQLPYSNVSNIQGLLLESRKIIIIFSGSAAQRGICPPCPRGAAVGRTPLDD